MNEESWLPIMQVPLPDFLAHNESRKYLEDLVLALSQDLREYADAAAEAGQEIAATEALLAEVDAYFAEGDR